MTDELTRAIIGAAVEVHRILGPGLLESVYENALGHELTLRGISYVRQLVVEVLYKDHVIHGQRIDLVVQEAVIVEVKSVRSIPEIAFVQVLSYLKATRLRRALLINFGATKLVNGIKRISL